MIRPIAIGLAPNLEFDDALLAVTNLLTGKIFRNEGESLLKLETWFLDHLKGKKVYLLESGRSALFLALSSLKLKSPDEVIVQAFTCVAVPNSVLWAGAKPIYVDINKENLNVDLVDLQKKISKRTKAIIIQHTFGIPANLTEIMQIAKKNKMIVIEDCAHAIKTKDDGHYLGTFGAMSIFSFGRDKAISAVSGGALVVNNQYDFSAIDNIYKSLSFPSTRWNIKQHLHSITMLLILPTYNFFGLGKVILYLLQQLRVLTLPVTKKELFGKKPVNISEKMPEAIARLVLHQLTKIDQFNLLRKKYSHHYKQLFHNSSINVKDYCLLRYPLLVGERDKLLEKAKKKKIRLGSWYSHTVDPKNVDLLRVGYNSHCPTAEYVAQHIVNLPVYPTLTEKEVFRITSLFKQLNVKCL